MILVGLSGYGKSGKDSVGEVYTEKKSLTRAAFADEVRTAALLLDPVIAYDILGNIRLSEYLFKRCDGDWDKAKEHPEVRRTLQRLGTEVGREFFGHDIWIRMLANKIEGLGRVVITDVRFPNEATWIKDQGGIMLRISRPGVGPILKPDGKPHFSEIALDGWEGFNGMIYNDGTLKDLEQKALDQYRRYFN